MLQQVENLKMERVKRSIRWRGRVWLDQLSEWDDSLIGEAQWPPKSGVVYYACATSGLLFDKESGRCLQSINLTLDIGSLQPAKPKDFDKYISERRRSDRASVSRSIIISD